MLPIIENNSNMQLEEIPYRLPSRLQTCFNNSRLTKSYTAKISKRKDTYYRRAKTSCSMNFVLGDEQTKRPVNSCVDKLKMEISPQLFSHLNNEMSQKALIDQNRTFSLCKQSGNICFKEELSEILCPDEKPIWISELKMWITENSFPYDFMKLTNTATLHENKLWKNLSAKITKLKETNESKRKSTQIDNKRKENIHHFKLFDTESPKKNLTMVGKLSPSKDNKINKIKISTNAYVESKENKLLPIKSHEITEEIVPSFESTVNENSILTHNSSEKSKIMKNFKPDESIYKNVVKNDINDNIERSILDKNPLNKNEWLQTPNEENNINHLLHDDVPISLTNQYADDLPLANEYSKYSTNYLFNDIAIPNIPMYESNALNSQKTKENVSINIRPKQKKIHFRNLSNKTLTIHSDVSCENTIENPIELQTDLENQNEFNDNIFVETFVNNVNENSELPPLPILIENNKDFDIADETIDNKNSIRDKLAPLLQKQKARWGIKKRETRYLNDLENERKAEERKLKFINLINRVKKKKRKEVKTTISDDPRFESYGFLAKYCILEKIDVLLYRNTFDVCDENKKQWLNKNELIMALKGVNSNLKDFDINYLNMVMSTCDYNLQYGADFKLFSILAALSVKIIKLNSWIKNTLGNSDFKTLEKKTYFCRKLWEINVDPITNTIPLNLLTIELKAGGVKEQHIDEINERLGWIKELNILDFLTYIPLFVLMHSSILENPLDMSEKL